MASLCPCGERKPCARHPAPKRRNAGHWGAAYRAERDRLVPLWTADPLTRCHICGGTGHGFDDPWEPDHVTPAAAGGGLGLNLQPAHRYCNRAKGARDGAAKRKADADRKAEARIAATTAYLEDIRS